MQRPGQVGIRHSGDVNATSAVAVLMETTHLASLSAIAAPCYPVSGKRPGIFAFLFAYMRKNMYFCAGFAENGVRLLGIGLFDRPVISAATASQAGAAGCD